MKAAGREPIKAGLDAQNNSFLTVYLVLFSFCNAIMFIFTNKVNFKLKH